MPNNIYLGNLPEWVTADDIRSWLESCDLICDSIRVIRDFETQQSKGYAFLEAPTEDEMRAIIQRFHRAPIDGKLLQAKTAHPRTEKSKTRSRRRRRKKDDGTDGSNKGQGRPEDVGTFGEALQKAL